MSTSVEPVAALADDLTPRNLTALVLNKISEIGDERAREYFGVSAGTISAWRNGKNPPSLAAAQRAWDDDLVCQTPEIWHGNEKAHVQVLLPIYRYPHPLNHITLFINYKKYGSDKMTLIPRLRTLIDEARNDLAAKFLATKSEWCIMVDEDMILPVGSAAAIQKHGWNVPNPLGNRVGFERIMSHGPEYKIVGALYRDRRGNNRAQCAKGFGSNAENQRLLGIMSGKIPDTGIEEAGGWCGTGMIRIHRSVFEAMISEARPDGKLPEIAPPTGRETEPYGFFGRSSKWRGEDIALGRRAEMLGIKSYVDTGLYVGHEGSAIY